jgi:hypothetical protein
MAMAVARSADEVRDLLMVGTRIGKLAWTAPSGQPHVVPIWFIVDGAAELEVVCDTGKESAKGRAWSETHASRCSSTASGHRSRSSS